MAYLLDSDVFIEAKRRYYAFDFHPGFWEWLEQANGNGTLYSIDKVKDELLAVDDELAAWARGLTGFFLPIDEAAAASLAVTSAWVNGAASSMRPLSRSSSRRRTTTSSDLRTHTVTPSSRMR